MINQFEPLIGENEARAVYKYVKSGGFLTEFKETERFEKMLADYLGVKFVSLVPSGTVALYLSLIAAGINREDYTVYIPNFTMIATANAVQMSGATVELVDIEGENYCMDLDLIEVKTMGALFPSALIYVDINGKSGDMDKVKEFCKEYNLEFIEDACQAFGSKYKGKYLGTFGRFGCFSLSFHKIITTGQGGFIVTHNKRDYEIIERLKDYGRLSGGKDYHPYFGYNFKYTDLQAVVGIEQLKTIDWRIKKKQQIHEWYKGECPKDYVPWFIDYRFSNRKKMIKALDKKGIKTRPFYPPIHKQPIYLSENDLRVSTKISREGLWMPSSLTLEKKDIDYIKEVINENI